MTSPRISLSQVARMYRTNCISIIVTNRVHLLISIGEDDVPGAKIACPSVKTHAPPVSGGSSSAPTGGLTLNGGGGVNGVGGWGVGWTFELLKSNRKKKINGLVGKMEWKNGLRRPNPPLDPPPHTHTPTPRPAPPPPPHTHSDILPDLGI